MQSEQQLIRHGRYDTKTYTLLYSPFFTLSAYNTREIGANSSIIPSVCTIIWVPSLSTKLISSSKRFIFLIIWIRSWMPPSTPPPLVPSLCLLLLSLLLLLLHVLLWLWLFLVSAISSAVQSVCATNHELVRMRLLLLALMLLDVHRRWRLWWCCCWCTPLPLPLPLCDPTLSTIELVVYKYHYTPMAMVVHWHNWRGRSTHITHNKTKQNRHPAIKQAENLVIFFAVIWSESSTMSLRATSASRNSREDPTPDRRSITDQTQLFSDFRPNAGEKIILLSRQKPQ